jgi:hypothetical protein
MKIRFRHRNQSRIQQNITAHREYTSEAFVAFGMIDSSRDCAASCQLTVVPFGLLVLKP